MQQLTSKKIKSQMITVRTSVKFLPNCKIFLAFKVWGRKQKNSFSRGQTLNGEYEWRVVLDVVVLVAYSVLCCLIYCWKQRLKYALPFKGRQEITFKMSNCLYDRVKCPSPPKSVLGTQCNCTHFASVFPFLGTPGVFTLQPIGWRDWWLFDSRV